MAGACCGGDEVLAVLEYHLRPAFCFDAVALSWPESVSRPGVRSKMATARRPAKSEVTLPSMIVAPLDVMGEMVGVLALYSAASGAFNERDLDALLWVSQDLGPAVRMALSAERWRQSLLRLGAALQPGAGPGPGPGLQPVQFDAAFARKVKE